MSPHPTAAELVAYLKRRPTLVAAMIHDLDVAGDWCRIEGGYARLSARGEVAHVRPHNGRWDWFVKGFDMPRHSGTADSQGEAQGKADTVLVSLGWTLVGGPFAVSR